MSLLQEIDALLATMGETDYKPEQYDFFFRNCNHFCDDLAQRLLGDAPGCGVDRDFIEEVVHAESEAELKDSVAERSNRSNLCTSEFG